MSERPEPKFVPGELVVFIDRNYPQYLGMKTQILRAEWTSVDDGWEETGWGYWCDVDGPGIDDSCWVDDTFAKLPPDTPATFDAAIWQPKREGVGA